MFLKRIVTKGLIKRDGSVKKHYSQIFPTKSKNKCSKEGSYHERSGSRERSTKLTTNQSSDFLSAVSFFLVLRSNRMSTNQSPAASSFIFWKSHVHRVTFSVMFFWPAWKQRKSGKSVENAKRCFFDRYLGPKNAITRLEFPRRSLELVLN